MDIKKYRFINKNSYGIVDLNVFSSDDQCLDVIGVALKTGVNFIELKTNNISPLKMVNFAKKVRELTSFFEAILLIESRTDIAQLVCADGIFLNGDDIPPSMVRELINEENFLIGKNMSDRNIMSFDCDFAICKNSNIKEKEIPIFFLGNQTAKRKAFKLDPKYLED